MLIYFFKKIHLKTALSCLALTFLCTSFAMKCYADSAENELQALKTVKEIDSAPVLKKETWKHHQRKNKVNDNLENKDAEDIVKITVEDAKPLQIPEAFLQQLKERGYTGLLAGNGQGQVLMLSVDGNYINPCFPKSRSSDIKSSYSKAVSPCKLDAGINDTFKIIESRSNLISDCDVCQGNGYLRGCNIATNKYSCSKKTRNCDANSTCGD